MLADVVDNYETLRDPAADGVIEQIRAKHDHIIDEGAVSNLDDLPSHETLHRPFDADNQDLNRRSGRRMV